ncbi:MAG: hypothetical protein KDB73_19735, partial [Planctomycetes bacterium]|nr:hypothetical protein [Planctomycetota bacterium]
QAAAPAGLDESSRLSVGMDPHAGVPGMGGAGMGGMGGMGSGMPAGGGGFAWDLPAGWQEIPAPPATMAAFGMEAHVDTRMTVSRAGGTLEDNVQRWRRQMGLERASAAELGDLPHVEVLGAPGVLVDVEGTFQGMSGPSMAGARLLGIIVPQGRESVFLKLLGPAEAVEAEHDAFLAFATSLREAPAGSLPAGHPPMDGGGAMRPPARPRATTAPLAWDVPPGWEQVESRPPRLATFKPANTKDTQCLVTVLGGAGGGVAANLTEWRRQLGLGPLTDAEYAALERTSLLGTTAVFLKADGRTGTEDGSEGVAATLYGAILPRDEDTVFVKMWGPTEEMKPTWDAFRALVESLRE